MNTLPRSFLKAAPGRIRTTAALASGSCRVHLTQSPGGSAPGVMGLVDQTASLSRDLNQRAAGFLPLGWEQEQQREPPRSLLTGSSGDALRAHQGTMGPPGRSHQNPAPCHHAGSSRSLL